jgi:hypothetical protein
MSCTTCKCITAGQEGYTRVALRLINGLQNLEPRLAPETRNQGTKNNEKMRKITRAGNKFHENKKTSAGNKLHE